MKKIAVLLVSVLIVTLFAVAASAEVYLMGDINIDGEVTASDARLILRVGAELDTIDATKALIADINGDLSVTASDARAVLRFSADIGDDLGTIEINNQEKTELSGGISMNVDDFIKKFGVMSRVDTNDGTTVYANDNVTIVSDPEMIFEGNVNSISIVGGNFMLNGIYAGMDADDAVSALKNSKWIVKEENASVVKLSKSGMMMNLTIQDSKIVKVEYYVAISLVAPDDQETTTEPETTTQSSETTTKEPEATTQPSETTTKEPEATTQPPETTTKEPETTTQPPETTTQPPVENEAYNSLPEQIKSFITGEFSFKGYMIDKDTKDPVEIYSSGKVFRIGSTMASDGDVYNIDILADCTGTKTKMYVLSNDTMKYCSLDETLLDMIGLDASELNFTFGAVDVNDLIISERIQSEGDQTYTVYNIKNSSGSNDFYVVDNEIKRIIGYDNSGYTVQMLEINEFYTSVPAGKLSLDGYNKALFGLLEVLGGF